MLPYLVFQQQLQLVARQRLPDAPVAQWLCGSLLLVTLLVMLATLACLLWWTWQDRRCPLPPSLARSPYV